MPQRPMSRKRQKARRTKKLVQWRVKQSAQQVQPAGGPTSTGAGNKADQKAAGD